MACRGVYSLDVQDAPEPGDVIYENLEVSGKEVRLHMGAALGSIARVRVHRATSVRM